LQQMPAGVRRRISSARMPLRYDANGTMTGGWLRRDLLVPPHADE
jgi:hypothetical protein